MNIVIQTIKEHIANNNIRFVFPSQISAALWARKICTLGISRSVAVNRFLAWDRFKEFITEKSEKEPATAILRKLFAEALIRKNAGTFAELIPAEYAENGSIFAPYIARLLPSLALWEKLRKNAADQQADDPEDRDYQFIKKEYELFLERHHLFEPSWEETNIRKNAAEGFRYIIFFPELMEDFLEFDALLKAPQFVRIGAERVSGDEPHLVRYKSAREEIRSAVMEMQRLHVEQGVPYEDMAVSVPELEEMEPWPLKEFILRHIPFTRRAGSKLGETGAGCLFSLINECNASRFSFNSLKALVLNDHIPWENRQMNKDLIRFGIDYNCVSGYVQNGQTKDIWEEAFKQAYSPNDRELKTYYSELKKKILALTGSKSFKEIRKNYFIFRGGSGGLLNMENISKEDDAVLGRCIEELNALIELEEKLDDSYLLPASPYSFFLSCLADKEYVKANQKPGVNIFRWRVASAAPFGCHFVLNASQSAAPVLYQPMKFLRQDKRKRLGLEDTDATGSFFLLCDTGEDNTGYKCHTRISASEQSFSGWAVPHSFFASGNIVEPLPSPEDAYKQERQFWMELQSNAELNKIYPLQKNSYMQWKETLVNKGNNFSFFRLPVPQENPVQKILKEAVQGKDGYLTVSPTTDLNVYYNCSIKWLYQRIFKAEEFSLEAALLDDIALGILYHKILEELFAKIKKEQRVFSSRFLETYKRWALEITRAVIKEHRAFKGPLAEPLVSSQSAGMAKKIAHLLELEAKNLDGYSIGELEVAVSLDTGSILIKGIIDRVSISPDGEPVIIDYKTSYLPDQIAPDKLDEVPLSEFQIPLYIKLYEEKVKTNEGNPRVKGAYFYSINGRTIKTVVGEKARANSKTLNREDYAPFLEAAERQIEQFSRNVKELNLVPHEIRISDCYSCVYKTACRSAYFLNAL